MNLARARIEILGDSSSYQRSVKEAAEVTDRLKIDMKQLAVTAKSTADAQIKASLRKDARLREEIAAYRAVANAAVVGSKEQVVAANLATQAETRLARSLGVTAHESLQLAAASASVDRTAGRFGRGFLAGSGALGHFGRAAIFASNSVLGGVGLAFALKSTIKAAEESQRVLGQTRNATERSGVSWSKYGKRIKEAALAEANLSGFDDERLLGTFSAFLRRTGDVTKALDRNALAADVARGANIELESAQKIVSRASVGQARGLANIGLNARKGASGLELINLLSQKFSGSAAAYGRTAAGAQDRFSVAVQNTQELLGGSALPTITKYLNRGADWLSQSKNQKLIQHELGEAITFTREALHGLQVVTSPIIDGFKTLRTLTGGTAHAVEVLGGAFAILKLRSKLVQWGLIRSGIQGVGTDAVVASGEVSILSGRLAALRKLGPIVIPIALSFVPPDKKGQQALDKAGIGFLGRLPIIGHAEQQVAQAGQRTHDFLFGKPKPAPKPLGKFNPATRGFVQSTPTNVSGELKFGDPTTAARRILNQTFEQAKLLNPTITRKTFELGQKVAASYIDGLNAKTKQGVTLPEPKGPKRLSLAGRFNIAELKLANAQLTKTSVDDKVILLTEAAIVKQQIAATKTLKDRTALTSKLAGTLGNIRSIDQADADATKAAAAAAKERAKAAREHTLAVLQQRQFKVLGLDATGNPFTPNAKSLRKDLGKFSDAVSGTFLDTSKTQSVLSKIRRVLGGGLGLLSKDVRSTVKQMLDDLDQQLKDHTGGPETKAQKVNTKAFLNRLGFDLTPAQVRRARAELSQLTTRGTPAASKSGGTGGGGGDVIVHTHTYIDGKQIAPTVTRHQQKHARRNPGQRRGPHAGQ